MDKSLAEESLLNSLGVIERDKIRKVIKESILPILRNKFKKLEIDFQIYEKYLVFYISHLAFIDIDFKISFDLMKFISGCKTKEELTEYVVDYVSIALKIKWESYILKESD